jgi:hypothetical protein
MDQKKADRLDSPAFDDKGPKVLLLDIETAPIKAYVWSLWDQNIGLNQIIEDWHLLSCAAKWLGEGNVMYQDQSKMKKLGDDRALCRWMHGLLEEADIIITQNGKKFDAKKLNARFVMHGMRPPAGYKHIDTLQIAKKHFGFTSNKLQYLSEKLCTKHRKSQHKKFHGMELWVECLKRNREAWEEMELYNVADVLALEELYTKLIPWDNTVNFAAYRDDELPVCQCGSKQFQRRGFSYTAAGKFRRYQCQGCGSWSRGVDNILPKTKRASLLRRITG